MIVNALQGELGLFIVYKQFLNVDSSNFGIYKVSGLSEELNVAKIGMVNMKCILM